MQHSKKKKARLDPKQDEVSFAADASSRAKANSSRERSKSEPPPSQNIYGKPGVASNLRSRSKLYWIFACCAATQNVVISEDTPPTSMGDNSNKEN